MDKGYCQDGRNMSAPFICFPAQGLKRGSSSASGKAVGVCADCMHGVQFASAESLGDIENNYHHAHKVKCRKGTLLTWQNCVWKLWLTCFNFLGFLTLLFFSPHLKPWWVFNVCRKAHQAWQAGWAHYLVHRGGRAMSVPTLWSTCTMCDSLRWFLNKTEPLLHCNCCILRSVSLFSSLLPSLPPLFTCFLLVNGAADELGIEFMGKTMSQKLSSLTGSVCHVIYICKKKKQHNKTLHSSTTRPSSLEREKMKMSKASHHGNTSVVCWVCCLYKERCTESRMLKWLCSSSVLNSHFINSGGKNNTEAKLS